MSEATAVTEAAGARRRPFLLGISGASCSGKTWFAQRLQELAAGQSEVIDLDGYYHDRAFVAQLEHGYDNPAAIDAAAAFAHLSALRAGKTVDLPVYCYHEHRVTTTRICVPRPLLIVEGLFAFAHVAIRDLFDVKVWIDSPAALRFERRLARDVVRGRRSEQEITRHYERDVLPGFAKYVGSLCTWADLHLINNPGDEQGRGGSLEQSARQLVASALGEHAPTTK